MAETYLSCSSVLAIKKEVAMPASVTAGDRSYARMRQVTGYYGVWLAGERVVLYLISMVYTQMFDECCLLLRASCMVCNDVTLLSRNTHVTLTQSTYVTMSHWCHVICNMLRMYA